MTIGMTILALFITVLVLLFLFSFLRGLVRLAILGVVALFCLFIVYEAGAY